MLDFLFGSEEKETKVPGWMEDYYKKMITRADDVGQLGYIPNYGVDVAGLTPMQQNAFAGTNMAAQAYGLPSTGVGQYKAPAGNRVDPVTGVSGYSSGDVFDQSVSELIKRRTGQAGYYSSMFVDPVTGAPGSRTEAGRQDADLMALLDQLQSFSGGDNSSGGSNNMPAGNAGAPLDLSKFNAWVDTLDPKKVALLSPLMGLMTHGAQGWGSGYDYGGLLNNTLTSNKWGDAYNYGNRSSDSSGTNSYGGSNSTNTTDPTAGGVGGFADHY